MLIVVQLIACLGFVVQEEELKEPYESKAGKFTAKFPGKPKETVNEVPTAVGNIKAYFIMHESPTGAYAVSYSDYPKGHVERAGLDNVLKGAREGAAKNVKGTLKSHKAIKQGKHKGQSVTIVAAAFEIQTRHFVVGDRLYQVLVAGKVGTTDNDTTKAFLDSFKIK